MNDLKSYSIFALRLLLINLNLKSDLLRENRSLTPQDGADVMYYITECFKERMDSNG